VTSPLHRRNGANRTAADAGDAPPGPRGRIGALMPYGMSRAHWAAAIRSAGTHMRKDRVSVGAGAFAYRWFLALFPIIIALLAVASVVAIPRHTVVSLIGGVTHALPPGASDVFNEAIRSSEQHRSGALATTVVASAVALWSSTSGMAMLEEGLDMAYELPTDRSFLRKRLLALPLLAAALVLGGAASALTVFGPQLSKAIGDAAPGGAAAFIVASTVVRWVVALGLVGVLISIIYFVAPNRARPPWQWLVPGAVLATAVWAVVSLGFSLYTSRFGSYGKTYGAFAGVAILIFWLYLTGLAILVGGEDNAAVERVRAAHEASHAGSPAPSSDLRAPGPQDQVPGGISPETRSSGLEDANSRLRRRAAGELAGAPLPSGVRDPSDAGNRAE